MTEQSEQCSQESKAKTESPMKSFSTFMTGKSKQHSSTRTGQPQKAIASIMTAQSEQ
jgi:hypothetical protein